MQASTDSSTQVSLEKATGAANETSAEKSSKSTLSESTLPAWNNKSEYASLTCSEFANDVELVQRKTKEILVITKEHALALASPEKKSSPDLTLALQKIAQLVEDAGTLLSNVSTFTHLEMALDAGNAEAIKMNSQLMKLSNQFKESYNSYELYLTRTTEENLRDFLSSSHTQTATFYWTHARSQKDFLLSEAEENLVLSLNNGGPAAWGNLYNSLSGTLSCEIEIDGVKKSVGLAEAHAITRGKDEAQRKMAWHAIQKTWNTHRETAASILNALAEWRTELNKKRSTKREKTFLADPLFMSRIQKETLEAMYAVIERNLSALQEGAKKMARQLGKEKLDPWDLLAPAPVASAETISFEEGFQQIRDSFAAFDPRMGEFVELTLKNGWIDARVLPKKQNGAFCSGFAKSKTPRVFQTYMGSSQDVSTLAHELGHAYHSWVLRDLSPVEQDYPMTLAETASIFSEQILFQYQLKNAKSADERLDVAWSLAESAVGLLLNIGARFEFEKNFYQKKSEGFVSADELSELMSKSYSKWYGDSISQTDPLFWAHKLHFSIAELSFYNFPYTFGYLFSLSLFARQNEFGEGFHDKYVAVLRDTGRMTAEDLILKHLNEDIRKPQFWQKSIDVVLNSMKLL